jgi:glycosyltransferase involved in cell wall biosynthesis
VHQSFRAPIDGVVVVVPARNEEQRLGACLDAIEHAVRRVHAHPLQPDADGTWATPEVRVVVVLDACTDGSSRVAEAHDEMVTIETRSARVGAARAYGVDVGLGLFDRPLDQLWVASTDADSRVPPNWLTHQLDIAHAGADVFCGLVQPDVAECGPAVHAAWSVDYQRREGHPHVHGANLGLRATAYRESGGFDPSATAHEDVRLIRAARVRGLTVRSSREAVVTTSGRTYGRVGAAGFADYLGHLLLGPDLRARRLNAAT